MIYICQLRVIIFFFSFNITLNLHLVNFYLILTYDDELVLYPKIKL